MSVLLPPRGSFVIVQFSTSLKLSVNIIRGVRNLFHMILENVCIDVCVCMYVYRFISGSTRSIVTIRFSFFLFFYSEFGKKIIFHDLFIRFCFISNFWFSKNLFLIFFNPLKTRQNLAEISRNELCHPLHNQKKNTSFFFCRLQLFITNYLNK